MIIIRQRSDDHHQCSMLSLSAVLFSIYLCRQRMTHSCLMTDFQWNLLFSSAVSGNTGWAENYSITPPRAGGNTLRINKYTQCQLYTLMTLIARKTGADAWWCLEFEICFIDCQSDELSGAILIIQIIMFLLTLLVEPIFWNHKITLICCLSMSQPLYIILIINIDAALSAFLALLWLVREGLNPQCRFKQRFTMKNNQPNNS